MWIKEISSTKCTSFNYHVFLDNSPFLNDSLILYKEALLQGKSAPKKYKKLQLHLRVEQKLFPKVTKILSHSYITISKKFKK